LEGKSSFRGATTGERKWDLEVAKAWGWVVREKRGGWTRNPPFGQQTWGENPTMRIISK